MTNQEKIQAVNKWQTSNLVYPMTCTTDNKHKPLEPIEENNKVVLKCPDCGRIQEYIPEVVMAYFNKDFYSKVKKYRDDELNKTKESPREKI